MAKPQSRKRARLVRENHESFHGKSLAELAREQGVGPVKDISVFAGVFGEDENVDEMIKEIYRLREPPIRRRHYTATDLERKRTSSQRVTGRNAERRRNSKKREP
jgi:hypothetical protein